ncbi:MAG TPA: PH domain-containing protein [Mycobacterium sp.]|jgi:uncharacterized membrane protein YdbT with pleckstrin-like domain|nr:PH domain-containing protein [Mycobacterium sp.]
MRYPDNALADDEQVVLHRHPHWKRLIGAVAALIGASASGAFVAAVVNATDWHADAKTMISAAIWAVWAIVVGWLTLWPFAKWLTTHFVITDRRVMFRRGVLTRSGIDLPLARIAHVRLQHRLIDRMLRTGTLVIDSASQEPLWFYDIPRVRQVHALLCYELFDTSGSDESPR